MERVAGERVMGDPYQPYDPLKVKVLSAREAVRSRPALYLDGDGDHGLHQLLWYALDGLIGHYQVLARDLEAVDLRLDADGSVTIQGSGSDASDMVSPDDIGLLEKELTVLGMDVPIGLFIVNVLSSRLVVTRRSVNREWVVEFADGVRHSSIERLYDGFVRDHVTITFLPDTALLAGIVTYDLAMEAVHRQATTYPTIAFTVVDVQRIDTEI